MDILFKSIIAGIITGIILMIAKFFGPKIAGVIAGIPIVGAVSYIFITLNDKNLGNNFLIGGIYGAIASILFSGVLIWLNFKFINNLYINFAIAYILCIIFVFILMYFTSK